MRRFRASWIIRRRKYVLTGLLFVILMGILLTVSLPKTTNTSTSRSLPPSVNNRESDLKGIISDDFIQQERKFFKKRPFRRSSGPRVGSHSTETPRNQKEFVENRVRSLKTLMGAVLFKDLLFTPKYPGIWKGYSEKELDMKKQLSSKFNLWGNKKKGGDTGEQNSEHLAQESDSEYLKTLLADSKQKKESKLERKKLDPKTRLQNDMLKLKAFQSKLLSKMKEAENVREKESDKVIEKHAQQTSLENDCNSPFCKEYLTTEDSSRFQYCKQKAKIELDTEPQASIICRFMNGSKRHSVALAGYPASDRTQVRKLLQQVTGLCTGGVNCDVTLRRNGFPGEYIVSGAVLVVESDQLEPCWIGDPCSKSTVSRRNNEREEIIATVHSAIYLIRNPLDAMREVWVNSEETLGHLDEFVASQTLQWQQLVLTWVVDAMDRPVLVVKYEDLVENTQVELKRMLDFLQVPYKSSELEMVEFYNEDTSYQKRNQPQFSEENKQHVLSVVRITKSSLEEAGLSSACDLSSYMKN